MAIIFSEEYSDKVVLVKDKHILDNFMTGLLNYGPHRCLRENAKMYLIIVKTNSPHLNLRTTKQAPLRATTISKVLAKIYAAPSAMAACKTSSGMLTPSFSSCFRYELIFLSRLN